MYAQGFPRSWVFETLLQRHQGGCLLGAVPCFPGVAEELGKACRGRRTWEVWSLLFGAPQGQLGSSRTYREASVGRQIYRAPSLLQTRDL